MDNISRYILSPQLRTAITESINEYNQGGVQDLKSSAQFQQSMTKEKVQEAVDGLNQFLQPINTSIRFEYHEELDEYYVEVIDTMTEEIVKEIPPKKLLDFYAAMTEFVGLMVDKKI
ncbi:flagellar protein FlaG [Peribacillus asahii]|uniref:flagellar protein FlaG n=1 Tax=Peribacillus asahii TaxID=228899 RepID=UPI0038047392